MEKKKLTWAQFLLKQEKTQKLFGAKRKKPE